MGGPVSKILTLNLEWRQLEWPANTPKNAIPNLEWPDIIQKCHPKRGSVQKM